MAYCDWDQYFEENLNSYSSLDEIGDVVEKESYSNTTEFDIEHNYPDLDMNVPTKKNENKCPIYVHDYKKKSEFPCNPFEHKIDMYKTSTNCGYSQNICKSYFPRFKNSHDFDSNAFNNSCMAKSFQCELEKKFTPNKTPTTKKKSDGNLKLVLDQLEESYWASWKPRKTDPNHIYSNNGTNKCEDVNVTKYFGVNKKDETISMKIINNSDIETGTSSLVKQTSSKKCVPNKDLPVISIYQKPKSSEQSLNSPGEDFVTPTMEVSNITEKTTKNTQRDIREGDKTESLKGNDEQVKEEDIKEIKHTDSLILNKKKQNIEKERLPQPKCLRLYKTTPISTSSKYFKNGGNFPLKSCLKKNSTARGSFRLGPPGSLLIVTNNKKAKNKKI